MKVRTGIAAALFGMATLLAQQPAPGGEVKLAPPAAKAAPAPWPKQDAELLATLLRHRQTLLDQARIPGKDSGLLGSTWDTGSACCGVFSADAAGDIGLHKELPAGRAFCIAAWPKDVSGPHRVGILLHSDGTTMVCEPTGDAAPLTPDVFTARGSNGTFADVLRQPGTSQTGHLWLWLDQMATTATITVVDESGQPRAGAQVLMGPIGTGFHSRSAATMTTPMPVAFASTDAKGTAQLRGPLHPNNNLWLQCGSDAVLTARCRITQEGNDLRVVVPQRALVATRALTNESAAISTLKNIGSAQAQCQACGVVDGDRDGAGEYGFFGELSGKHPVRNDAKGGVGDSRMSPPVLSQAFSKVQGSRIERSGYLFQMFLPDADGCAVAEADTGGAAGVHVDPRHAKAMWCAYAWPADEKSGLRSFFINQHGEVMATTGEEPRYVGTQKPPLPTAAFEKGSSGKLDAKVAAGGEGIDGGGWTIAH